MDKVSLKAGLKKAIAISSIGNPYLQRKQRWKALKENRKEEAGGCLTFAANLAIITTIVLEPFYGTR